MSEQQTETPVLDLLGGMTALSLEATTLDARSVMIARLAALVAIGAPPISYVLNLSVAGEADVTAEDVRGVFAAVAPVVGTAKVAQAAGAVVKGLALESIAAEIDAANA
jgi:alkylhydroperoxidase/carboxymuconolactone decarboxylase family protein YurZ